MANDGLTIDTQALREKILNLAMRGKLVPQNPNDEPASELLEKITDRKNELIKNKKIKNNKVQVILGKDKLFEVPKSWKWVRFNQILDVRDGTHDTPKYITGQGVPLVTAKNLTNNTIDFTNLKNISKADADEINKRSKVDVNDILFAMIGTIGNPVLVRDKREFAIKNVALLKSFGLLNMEYVYYYINFYQSFLLDNASGGNQKFVSLKKIRNSVIPLPPLAEQSRIAAKVARLFALLRKVESSNDEYNLLKQIMKDKIINLAMEGKLVKQDPHDEPASVLVKKIADEKAQLIKEKKIKRTKKLPAITDEEKPFDIPDSWEWVHLEAISYLIGGKSNQIKEKESLETGKYRVVSQSQKKFIGFTNESSKVLSPQIDCIVFGDHTALVKYINFDFVIGGDGVKVFETLPGVDTKYLYYAFRYNLIGIAGLGGYSRHFKYIKNKPIPLPPLQEQKRIVYKIEQFMKWLDGEAL